MNNLKNKFLLTFFNLFLFVAIYAQQKKEKVIDRIVAVVATNPILQSELDTQYQQMLSEQTPVNAHTRCDLLEELLYQKLLLAQAQKDSLDVTDAQIEQEMDRRINYFIQQFGSEEKFTAFYGKSVEDFKADLKDNVRDLLLSQQMQSKITGDINVTPNDVKTYYKSIPEDSIPFINTEVEVGQIVKKPMITAEAKKEAKEKITAIRERIMKGESFATLAALYSQDPGSASKGGKYEHIQRGQFVPEWDAMAFKMKPNEVSDVFETMYGYFIIQLIERRGDEVDARSLLIAPKEDVTDLLKAKLALDTIYTKLYGNDSITFAEAAAKYSGDDDSKNSGGLIINPYNGTTRFEMSEIGQIDQTVAFAIDKLKVGEMTKPMPMTTHDGKQAYRIVYLKTRTSPHKANLTDDYQKIQAAALSKKQQEAINTWIKKKVSSTYVHLADDFKDCKFNNKWIN